MSKKSLDDTQPLERTQPMQAVEKQEAAPRARRQWPFGYMALWVLMVLSLLLNVVMVRQMLLARQAAQAAVDGAIALIDSLQGSTFSTSFHAAQSLHIVTDLPIDETIPVVIRQDMPIDTTVSVPIDAGALGTYNVDVPIKASIPINITQDVRINQPFHVDTQVPITFDLPINLSVADTPLADTLDQARTQLESLSAQFNQPIVPIPGRKQP